MALLSRVLGLATNGLAGGLVGGAALLALFLYNLWRKQESLLYHPTVPGLPFKRIDDTPAPFNSPAAWGLAHEEHYLETADGTRVHMWFVTADCDAPESAPTIAFFHANAGNMGLRLPNVAMLASAIPANVAIIDYRGYGNSDGTPSEAGLQLDADALMRHLAGRTDIDPKRLFLFGRSLGGAVAFRAAANQLRPHESIAGLIVENTFTSIDSLVDTLLPWLAPFKALVLRMHWPSVDVLPRLPAELPLLLISGELDALVPPAHALALAAAARTRRPATAGGPTDGGTVATFVVPGGGHDDSSIKGGAAYVAALRRFMDGALLAADARCGGLAAAGPPRPVRVPAGAPLAMVPHAGELVELGSGAAAAAAAAAVARVAAARAARQSRATDERIAGAAQQQQQLGAGDAAAGERARISMAEGGHHGGESTPGAREPAAAQRNEEL